MLIPRRLSRVKLTLLLSVLAVVSGVVVYLVAVNLGGSNTSSILAVAPATFGGTLDTRLELPDPNQVLAPTVFDSSVGSQLQDDGTLPATDGQRPNPDPFSPLPAFAVKKR